MSRMYKVLATLLLFSGLSLSQVAAAPGVTGGVSSGGGSGTVNSGSTGEPAYYAANGTTVSGYSGITFSGSGSNTAISLGYVNFTGGAACNYTTPSTTGGMACQDKDDDALTIIPAVVGGVLRPPQISLLDTESPENGLVIDYSPGQGAPCGGTGTLGCVGIVDAGGGSFVTNNGVEDISDGNGDDFELQTGTATFSTPVLTPQISLVGATAPSSNHGSLAGANNGGYISGLSSATSVTITFAGSTWATWASCTANASVTGISIYISSISTSAVTFNFTSLTGTLYYGCNGA
jgi:hypothetical protein